MRCGFAHARVRACTILASASIWPMLCYGKGRQGTELFTYVPYEQGIYTPRYRSLHASLYRPGHIRRPYSDTQSGGYVSDKLCISIMHAVMDSH